MSLYSYQSAKDRGFDENMYLDSSTRTYVEETGGANFLFVTRDGRIVTPRSDTILPSITRRSLMAVAKKLGMKTEERPVALAELRDFAECGLCGTAAVISPVGSVTLQDGTTITFDSGMSEMGPVTRTLYDTLTGIQMGRLPDTEGWVVEIE